MAVQVNRAFSRYALEFPAAIAAEASHILFDDNRMADFIEQTKTIAATLESIRYSIFIGRNSGLPNVVIDIFKGSLPPAIIDRFVDDLESASSTYGSADCVTEESQTSVEVRLRWK